MLYRRKISDCVRVERLVFEIPIHWDRLRMFEILLRILDDQLVTHHLRSYPRGRVVFKNIKNFKNCKNYDNFKNFENLLSRRAKFFIYYFSFNIKVNVQMLA